MSDGLFLRTTTIVEKYVDICCNTHTRAKNLPTRLLLQVILVLPLVLVPISRLSMPNRRRLAAREIQPQTERYT